MENSKVDSPDISPEISQVPQESEPQTVRGRSRWAPVRRILNLLTRPLLAVGVMLPGLPPADVLASAQNVSSKDQGHELQLKTGMPSLEQQVNVKNWAGPEESAKELLEHPHNITAMAFVPNEKGDVSDQFVVEKLADNRNILYKSQSSPENATFPPFQAISEIPMGSVNSLIASGKIMIAGGAEKFSHGDTKIFINYKAGKEWKPISWEFGDSGATVDFLKVTDNIFIGNNAPWMPGVVSQFIINIDPDTQTEKLMPVKWKKDGQAFDVGFAAGLTIVSIDAKNQKVKLVSNGSMAVRYGVASFELDYKKAEGTVKYITTVMVEGESFGLGTLRGKGAYIGKDGHVHSVVSSSMRQYIVDVDHETKKATLVNYGGFLDNRGIRDYTNSNLFIYTTDVYIDDEGEQLVILGGGIQSNIDALSRPALIIMRGGKVMKFINLMPQRPVAIGYNQHDLWRVKYQGMWGYEFNMEGIGKGFWPDESPSAIFTTKGLGSALPPSENKADSSFGVTFPYITTSNISKR